MSTVVTPTPVTAPRGAAWAATAFVALLDLGRGVAAMLAARHETRLRLREAADVRAIADGYARGGDPRMAADLYAAADRHVDAS